MAESRVKVKLQMDDVTGDAWIRVEVFSARKPANLSYCNIPVNVANHVRYVEAAGAELADRVNKVVGDNIDPADCARKAIEAFEEATSRFEQEWDRMRGVTKAQGEA